jgi:hypothetical protein
LKRGTTEVNDLPQLESEFEKWLFVSIASVLFAGKAGELLMINAEKYGLSVDRLTERISALSGSWGFSFLVICRCDVCVKVVIYDQAKIQETLSQVSEWTFNKLGYPSDIDPNEFLEEIERRWQNTGEIPHEIGLALGYPVKDVLGYMGLMSSRCTGTCGWRVYGDIAPSLRSGRQYGKAKKQAVAFVNNW